MSDHNLDTPVPGELVSRLVQRSLDGVLIVDELLQILLTNELIPRMFGGEEREEFVMTGYLKSIFQLNPRRKKDEKRAQKIPLFRAFVNGETLEGDPHIVTISTGGVAYQVETRIAGLPETRNGRLAIEFWRPKGDPEVFKDDEDFIAV